MWGTELDVVDRVSVVSGEGSWLGFVNELGGMRHARVLLGIEAAHPNGWRSGSQKQLRRSLRCFSLSHS